MPTLKLEHLAGTDDEKLANLARAIATDEGVTADVARFAVRNLINARAALTRLATSLDVPVEVAAVAREGLVLLEDETT